MADIARCFGTDATSKAVNHAIARHVKPAVKMINDQLAAGRDPKDLAKGKFSNTRLNAHHTSHLFAMPGYVSFLEFSLMLFLEIVACYGSTTTKPALQTHFARDITPNVKLIQDIRAQGGDAKDVVLIEGVRHGNPGKGQQLHTQSTYHISLV